MSNYFEGWYIKHQAGDQTLALIPGRSKDGAFIQVITNERAYNVPFPLSAYKKSGLVTIGENAFSTHGVSLQINEKELSLTGMLRYHDITPVAYDVMGPFRFLPMECKHSVVSMLHSVEGTLVLNGRELNFLGGKGYIEGDRGTSFPERYTWVQCNDFEEDCAIMASIAKIPFAGFRFWGCICIVYLGGKEYRLATYKGAQVRERAKRSLSIEQGNLRLTVTVADHDAHALLAPQKGTMARTIHESPACEARFEFTIDGKTVVFRTSKNAGYEFV